MADPHQYCTTADLAKRISQEGLSLRVDDDETSGDDCCQEATALIDTYIGRIYPPDQVPNIPIVKYACRLFALYFLCQRRNETPTETMEKEFTRYTKMLESIAAGELVPMDVPRPAGGCAVSNQTYDNMRYPANLVEGPRSTDVTQPDARQGDPTARPTGRFGWWR